MLYIPMHINIYEERTQWQFRSNIYICFRYEPIHNTYRASFKMDGWYWRCGSFSFHIYVYGEMYRKLEYVGFYSIIYFLTPYRQRIGIVLECRLIALYVSFLACAFYPPTYKCLIYTHNAEPVLLYISMIPYIYKMLMHGSMEIPGRLASRSKVSISCTYVSLGIGKCNPTLHK